ncbi:MAG TPA: enoyl-CoA hydratase-related protein [Xanthobacteraceae bacterium]|jgi:enoyl-CoA hydratase/carnithine racemase
MNDELIVERHGPVSWLTVNRPEVRNALSLEITQRIAGTLRDLSRDRAVRVFVLTGAGDRVFVSGADVREFREQLSTPETALRYDAAAEELQSALREIPQPVIAMIQGHAVGSGTIVAASCDFRIAVRTAKLGIPVAKFGFVAPVPDTLRLVQLIGPAKTKWLLMTGQLIGAPEARAIGLIDEVVEPEQLKPRVEALAATLAANAPLTIKATKQIIETLTAPRATVASGAPWYAEIFRSHDFKAGLDAFFDKRKPEFKGE